MKYVNINELLKKENKNGGSKILQLNCFLK